MDEVIVTTPGRIKPTRQSGPLLDPDLDFPPIYSFKDKNRLPTYSDVIGVLRYLLDGRTTNISYRAAFNEVKKIIYSKWYHDMVFCITPATILKRIQKD